MHAVLLIDPSFGLMPRDLCLRSAGACCQGNMVQLSERAEPMPAAGEGVCA